MPDNYQLYNPEDLQDLENKGWMQMQEMLDKHLPQEAPVRKMGIAPLWKWLAAACVVAGIAAPLIIKLNNKTALSTKTQAVTLRKSDSSNNTVVLKGKSDTGSHLNDITRQQEMSNDKNKETVAVITSTSTDSINKQVAQKSIAIDKNAASLQKLTGNKKVAPLTGGYTNYFDSSKLQIVSAKPSNALPVANTNSKKDNSHQVLIAQNTKPTPEQKPSKPEKPYWPEEEHEDNNTKRHSAKTFNLALLLNRNTNAQQRTGNSLYDIPAYPSVTASIRLNDNIGITTGLTANAPGNFNLASSGGGPSAMNFASPSMVNSKTDVTTYGSSSASYLTQAYYWQVPLTFDYFPVKNVKLYAGANLAFVQKVLLTDQGTNAPMLKSNNDYKASGNDNGASYTLKQFDPRMTVGGFYQIKSLMLGVQYSRALQPSLSQRSADIPNSNNSIVNFSIGIKLFDKHK